MDKHESLSLHAHTRTKRLALFSPQFLLLIFMLKPLLKWMIFPQFQIIRPQLQPRHSITHNIPYPCSSSSSSIITDVSSSTTSDEYVFQHSLRSGKSSIVTDDRSYLWNRREKTWERERKREHLLHQFVCFVMHKICNARRARELLRTV